jgi:EAL domain-containing protein (putative c-di-GMP-specific phosphodiesterase class I)
VADFVAAAGRAPARAPDLWFGEATNVGLQVELERGRRALASALISFAREMNEVVVAEGIETPSAVATLLSLGVTCGQGFHIGRPRPLEAALDAAAEA